MSKEHESKISSLYRQSSQETPPAHLDRVVMDRARKSVRRRLFAPFGDNWVAHGAVMGVIILSVMLLLDVPQQPDDYVPARDAVASTIPAGPHCLQAGSFSDKDRAAELMTRLTELGFKCEIREVTINNTDIDHRVRVGPFTDLEVLDKTRQKLDELGIETRMVKDRQ